MPEMMHRVVSKIVQKVSVVNPLRLEMSSVIHHFQKKRIFAETQILLVKTLLLRKFKPHNFFIQQNLDFHVILL